MDINLLLNQTSERYIAEQWRLSDFRRESFALSRVFRDKRVHSVALWFEDAALLASALFAAWQAGADVYLPPDLSDESKAWAEQNGCLWLSDGDYSYHLAAASKDTSALHFYLLPESRLFLKTSGSGGEAKTVVKTLAQMQSEAMALAAVLPSSWRGMTAHSSVSAQHLYGLTFRIFTALACGWLLGRTQCRYPEDLIAAAQTPCIWIASPAVLNRFGDKRDWFALRQNVCGILSAGGMLPESTACAFQAHLGLYPTDIYGSTETGAIAIRQGSGEWQLLPQVNVTAEEDALSIVSDWSGGRQKTADSADIRGRSLILHGRSDRIVKLGDKRVSLNRLEQALCSNQSVADAYCFIHSQYNRTAAWVALSEQGIGILRNSGRKALIAALKQHLAKQFDKTVLPRYWRFTETLPRNTQSKIRAQDVQAAFTGFPTEPDWTLQSEDNEKQEYLFSGKVPLDLSYFSGHFAAFPLVPGVVEIQWARDLASRFPWGKGGLSLMENLKYQQFVRPNDEIEIKLRFDAIKGKILFSVEKEGKTCASGRMVKHEAA